VVGHRTDLKPYAKRWAEAVVKPREDGAYVHQHFNFNSLGKVHGRKAKASNRTLGNPAVRQRVQTKRVCSVGGGRPTEVTVRSLVARIAECRETESLKPIDKAILRMVSESLGRNESERRFGLERLKPQKPSPLPKGEGSRDRRNLADAAVHTGGVKATAR
jgi:hypothetical protein